MTAISSSAEAMLYMGASTADPLPAPGSDTFTKIPQLKTLQVPTPSKSSQKENTLDGVTIASTGTPQWSNCTGSLLTNYTQSVHNTMLADVATGGRKRNWYVVEPDAGARRTDFQGELMRLAPGQYAASLEGAPAQAHEFEIATSGVPTITP